MKKIYQKPNTDIVVLEGQQLMVQASLSNQEITDPNKFGSREYDDWDE